MVQRPDLIGQQFGSYRLLRLLGAGGFAEVYLGEHIDLGTQAAIKVLHTQMNPTDIETFRKEARTIARLRHPHIIRVLDFSAVGSTPFLVMDYAAGGTIRERYPKGTIVPLPTIVSYIQQIADALQYAHDQNFIHRDIKPENILLDQRHNVLLSDFGIALVAQSSRYQNTQDVVGTGSYMSPEQIQGKPRPASDQYSLGIVVYEWLSGTRPFEGTFTELLSQHMFAPPPPLHEKVPTISLEVEHVVTTALAKDPKQRFRSMRAFATALGQASENMSSSGRGSYPPTFSSNPGIPPTVKAPTSQSLQSTKTQSTSPQKYSSGPYMVPSTPPLVHPYAPQPYPYPYPYPYPPQTQGNEPGSGAAIAGMVLGIISLVFLCGGIGIITAIVGLFLSIRGRRSVSRRGMATAGLVMCIIALVLGLVIGFFIYLRIRNATGG